MSHRTYRFALFAGALPHFVLAVLSGRHQYWDLVFLFCFLGSLLLVMGIKDVLTPTPEDWR